MTVKRPPTIASWLLLYFSDADEGLIGDLFEEYLRRGSSLWYWRQVAIAIVVGSIRGVWHHKLETVQAVFTGSAALFFGGQLVREPLMRWFSFLAGSPPLPPWPWNNVYMLFSAVMWFAIAIAAGMLIGRLHPARRATMTFAILCFLAAMSLPEWYRLAMNAVTSDWRFIPYLRNTVSYFVITGIGFSLGSLWNRRASYAPHGPHAQM